MLLERHQFGGGGGEEQRDRQTGVLITSLAPVPRKTLLQGNMVEDGRAGHLTSSTHVPSALGRLASEFLGPLSVFSLQHWG